MKRKRDSRMALGTAGSYGEQCVLENASFGLRRWGFEELVAHASRGGSAPEGIEAHMHVVEFAAGKLEERISPSGLEVDAGDARSGGRVDAERLRVRTANDAFAESFPAGQIFAGEDGEAAGAEVENEFDGAVGKQALFGVGRSGRFHDPYHFDEAVERRKRFVTVRHHEASLLSCVGGAN